MAINWGLVGDFLNEWGVLIVVLIILGAIAINKYKKKKQYEKVLQKVNVGKDQSVPPFVSGPKPATPKKTEFDELFDMTAADQQEEKGVVDVRGKIDSVVKLMDTEDKKIDETMVSNIDKIREELKNVQKARQEIVEYGTELKKLHDKYYAREQQLGVSLVAMERLKRRSDAAAGQGELEKVS